LDLKLGFKEVKVSCSFPVVFHAWSSANFSKLTSLRVKYTFLVRSPSLLVYIKIIVPIVLVNREFRSIRLEQRLAFNPKLWLVYI
jgi:hypothetical protein